MSLPVLVALAGTATVFVATYLFLPSAADVPVLSAGDAPRLILLGLGAGWSLLGTVQALRLGRGGFKKVMLSLVCLATLALAGASAWWVVDYSYRLPKAIEVKALDAVKPFSGTDQNGATVSDASMKGKAYAMVFTRGFW